VAPHFNGSGTHAPALPVSRPPRGHRPPSLVHTPQGTLLEGPSRSPIYPGTRSIVPLTCLVFSHAPKICIPFASFLFLRFICFLIDPASRNPVNFYATLAKENDPFLRPCEAFAVSFYPRQPSLSPPPIACFLSLWARQLPYFYQVSRDTPCAGGSGALWLALPEKVLFPANCQKPTHPFRFGSTAAARHILLSVSQSVRTFFRARVPTPPFSRIWLSRSQPRNSIGFLLFSPHVTLLSRCPHFFELHSVSFPFPLATVPFFVLSPLFCRFDPSSPPDFLSFSPHGAHCVFAGYYF